MSTKGRKIAVDLTSHQPIRLGVIGLGMAGAVMVYAASKHPGVQLVAAADPQPAPRDAFVRDFGGDALADARQLCERPDIQAVYIATPHQFHREHAILAAQCGKHIIVEKPLAISLEDCDAIIEAAERNNIYLIVGHTHAFDPAVRCMRDLIQSGEIGELGLIAMWNYTNFIYRPRRPEELDTSLGGGIIFNQIPHQIDTIRLLGGGVASVRAYTRRLDPSRPTEGLASALLQLKNGAAATLTYSGYDHFDSDELHHWIAESGSPKTPGQQGAAYRALVSRTKDETDLRITSFALGARPYVSPTHQPHFGNMVVTGSQGDLRASRDGVLVYNVKGLREIQLAKRPGVPGRNEVLDDLCAAIHLGHRPPQDARWGRETLAVALAIKASGEQACEIQVDDRID